MAHRGRPTVKDKREKQYRVRLNDAENDMLDYCSQSTGEPKSQIFRKALEEYYRKVKLNEYIDQEVELTGDMDHISLKRVIECPHCGVGNRIDFSHYLTNEMNYERQIGVEIKYTFDCDAYKCSNCGEVFHVTGSIHEYPVGAYDSEHIEIE